MGLTTTITGQLIIVNFYKLLGDLFMKNFIAVLILVASGVNLNAGELKDSKCANGLCPLQVVKFERPSVLEGVVENPVVFSEQTHLVQNQTLVASKCLNSNNCKPVVYYRKSIFRRK
jgi:hypothetical protein